MSCIMTSSWPRKPSTPRGYEIAIGRLLHFLRRLISASTVAVFCCPHCSCQLAIPSSFSTLLVVSNEGFLLRFVQQSLSLFIMLRARNYRGGKHNPRTRRSIAGSQQEGIHRPLLDVDKFARHYEQAEAEGYLKRQDASTAR